MEHSLDTRRFQANVAASATDSIVGAAVPGRSLRLLGGVITSTNASSVQFNSKGSGAGTALLAVPLAANAAVVLDHEALGYVETNQGEGLSVTTGAGIGGVGLALIYALV